ncbi:MAG: hypothetical protein P1S60_03165, partial [Anaerolineae bacterium]|nr:hypothetical protein [Anaerolineae bacterium]
MSDEYQPNDVVEIKSDKVVPKSDAAFVTQPVSETIASGVLPRVNPTESPASDTDNQTGATAKVVNLADIDSSSSAKKTLLPALGGDGGLLEGKRWLLGVAALVVVIAFLFLPPLSLWNRIFSGGGYVRLSV